MNILILNLTRFGDLLQCAATLRALARSAGEAGALGVVCLDNFLAGAELLPDVSAIYPLAAGKLMAELHTADAGERPDASWLNGLASLHTWADNVRRHFAPDMVCNLSPTIAACLLGRLLAGEKNLVGFALDERGLARNTTPWATFLQGSSASRSTSPFNVVDLFRRIAGDKGTTPDNALLPAPDDARAAMRVRLGEASPPEGAGYLALQLGASAPARQWPVASFAAVGNALWHSHRLVPLLLGTQSEEPLVKAYTAHATGPFISLMGKTGITELAAALSLSSLLISNDTGTLHLGSGLGTPVLGIYLATAQACDTGPYALASCALEPDLACHPCDFGTNCHLEYACHTAIRPETVLALATARLDAGLWSRAVLQGATVAAGARIWETTRDAAGFADLRSLSGHEENPMVRWLHLQRQLYRHFFDGCAAPITSPPPHGQLAKELASACETVHSMLEACILQAEMVCSSPIPQLRERFLRSWERLNTTLASMASFGAVALVWRHDSLAAEGIEGLLPVMRRYRDFFLTAKTALIPPA